MGVVFHGGRLFLCINKKVVLSSTKDLQMLDSLFATRQDGRPASWMLDIAKFKLTQPSLVELGLGLIFATNQLVY
jgi:hypothetical protein